MGLISNGTTIFDNGSMASGFGADLKFISKATASSSASIEFTSGIDSTYKEYVFYFVNIHPATDNVQFQFNMSTDSGSNYNVTKTSTFFTAQHSEDDGTAVINYEGVNDLAQGTGFQHLAKAQGNANDEGVSGYLHIFNPSNTTFVKHFKGVINNVAYVDRSFNNFIAGYGNTTSAVDAIQFSMSSGNIDSGEILLFGVN